MVHTIRYSEEAAHKRDGLDAARRKAFDRAITVIAEHPAHEKSVVMGESIRHVRLTQDILCAYMILPVSIMVMVLNVFDNQDAVITDEED